MGNNRKRKYLYIIQEAMQTVLIVSKGAKFFRWKQINDDDLIKVNIFN